VYDPSIKEKVMIINEEYAKPMENTSTSKKILVTKIERNTFKKGGLREKKRLLQEKAYFQPENRLRRI
jgi:hypothetical protein